MACPFCDSVILKDEEIMRNDEWVLIYNLKPVKKGHSLLIPKRHVERFEDLSQAECGSFYNMLRKSYSLFKNAFQATAFTLILQDGKAAGQSVPHLHYHLIPRSDGDVDHGKLYQSIMLESEQRKPLTKEEMHTIVEELKKHNN